MVLEIVVGVGVDLEDGEGLRGEEPVSICFSHDNYTLSIIMPSGFAYRTSGNVFLIQTLFILQRLLTSTYNDMI